MSFYFAAIILGLAFCFLGFGIFISSKIFNFPDITTDGSYTLGACISAVMLLNNFSPILAVFISFFCGAIAGSVTGIISTKLKIEPLLSGILVMTSLYSVNLLILGKSNIPIMDESTIFSYFFKTNSDLSKGVFFVLMVSLVLFLIIYLLKTDFGLVLRASGSNEVMMNAMGVNTARVKIIGLSLSNGLTALSGCLVAQYQGFVDINMGVGIVILGLGSVMISESLLGIFKINSIYFRICGVIVGTLIFRIILAFSLDMGLDPVFLKLVSSLLVLIIIGVPTLKKLNHA